VEVAAGSPLPRPGSVRTTVARWWHGRYGARLVREVAIVIALLVLYRLGRALGRDDAARAFANAREVLSVEDWLGIDTERAWQQAVLEHEGFVRLLNRYYASVHFPVTVAFLTFIYIRAPVLVARMRYLFVSVTAVALTIHLVYPLAPPRMLDGYVDTMARYGPAIYEKEGVSSLANQFAAMPSMHVGWAVLVAYGVVLALRTRLRWLVVLHPTMTIAAVVLTANHYWLDAVVAIGLVAAALAVVPLRARWVRRPEPSFSRAES
jgi:PAP2 superfamily